MHLSIRADGGHDIGYGHFVRSNALAEELLKRDHTVTVATTTPQPARSVFPNTVEITELRSKGDSKPFIDWFDANQPDVVFTDSYPVDTKYQKAICDRTPLAVLQDDNRHAICANLFINSNLYAHDLDYEFVNQDPKMCLGTDYVLLRSEIRDRAGEEPPWREQPERALVTMGGSDTANLMPTVVRAFEGFDIHVDAIIGPGFSEAQERSIRAAAEDISPDVSVTRDPDDFVERMFQADFAVSTSSSTTYELLALGTPIVSVPVANNQESIAQALSEHNTAIVLKYSTNKASFRHSIERYLTDRSLRRDYREHGRNLVDGKGAIRIANEVADIV